MVMHRVFALFALAVASACSLPASAQSTVLKNVTLIDGTGAPPRQHATLILQTGKILKIQNADAPTPPNAKALDLTGKTVIPALINTHGHIGLLQGTKTASANYTKENLTRHLLQYQAYGIPAVQVMGTDHDDIYAWRDELRTGILPRIFTAGRGFGVPTGAPPLAMGMDQVYRPTTPEEVRKDVQELAAHHPDLVKIWVDDFYGQFPSMKPDIYAAIIAEAHQHHLRVAAHVFHLHDAEQLVDDGIDIFAHSIRDAEIPDALLTKMKRSHVAYIPTLALDDFATAYSDDPAWLSQPFFRNALEPGVYDMITSQQYKQSLTDPAKPAGKAAIAERAALPIALRNAKKAYDAGILVALGTDSGATPIRPFGFAEHRELQLLVQAGLTPLQAISVATRNGAELLHASEQFGTLTPGLEANFLVLDKDPSEDIRNTECISAVWQNGKQVSTGPASAP
jgi:imidazolonepropionase-like amidohydrolase